MVQATYKKLIIAFLLTAVCSIGLISYMYGTQVANDANNNIMEDSRLSTFNSSISANLQSNNEFATSLENGTQQEAAEPPLGEIQVGSIFGTIKTFFNGVKSTAQTIFVLLSTVLGVPPLVLAVFTVIIILIAILGWFLLIRTGQS